MPFNPLSVSPRPRIVFLNRSYWPDIEATGQLLTDLCGGLSTQFDVHVICGQPNSPEANCTFLQVGAESRDGVTIHRLLHRQHKKGNSIGRVLNLLSFFFAARRYLRTIELKADVVVSETDPFLLPIVGAEYARRVGAEHCVYLQDIYPDVAEAVGKVPVPFVAPFIRRKLRTVYRKAARIVVLGRCMRKRLASSPWGIHRDKIEIVPNWADCKAITPIPHRANEFRQRYNPNGDFIVMHSGNMGLTQRLEVLLDAVLHPNWPARAKLLIVGNGAARQKLLDHAKRLNLSKDRMEFVNYQPRHMLAESLSAADVHIVSMHENITGCLCPSKLYGIMAAGRSVIGIADSRTDLCQTIAEREIGWCVKPGSPEAIANAVAAAVLESRQCEQSGALEATGLSEAYQTRQRKSRDAAVRDYDRPVIIRHFREIFLSMVADHSIDLRESDVHQVELAVHQDPSDSGIALTL